MHHQREKVACSNTGVQARIPTDDELKAHFVDTKMRIMVLVEGVEPTLSCTFQSSYCYSLDQIDFEHEFVPCTSHDGGHEGEPICIVDYEKFHLTQPVQRASPMSLSSERDTPDNPIRRGKELELKKI
jgi:hypothetical protein